MKYNVAILVLSASVSVKEAAAQITTGDEAEDYELGPGRPANFNGCTFVSTEISQDGTAEGCTACSNPTNTRELCSTECRTLANVQVYTFGSGVAGSGTIDDGAGGTTTGTTANKCVCWTESDANCFAEQTSGTAATWGNTYCFNTDAADAENGHTCPERYPSSQPSSMPSSIPSEAPSSQPSSNPSEMPSGLPSEAPSGQPSSSPSEAPSAQPSEAPSANPSQGCANTRTDCGWGIFNPWTCQCDCPVGICLDNNEQCYHPCRETIHTNPWAGCSPGWDCPWFPDKEHGHCISELHQPNNFEIYRTAKECCDEHYPNKSTCLFESKDEHDPFPWPIHFPGTQPWSRPFAPLEIEGEGTNNEHHWGTEAGNGARWFPDLINQLNCVYGNNYEEWMTNKGSSDPFDKGFSEDYLFFDGQDCCEKWYPDKADCPSSMEAVDPEAEDEPYHSSPYSMDNYFFPDFSDNTCKYGRDYPAWMGINGYEKHYLFRTVGECCSRYFNGGSCGAASTTEQTGYFWSAYQDELSNFDVMPVRYNHTFYPDISSKTCVNGTDYPAWMADDIDFKRLYLFSTLDGCCTHWYTTGDKQDCLTNVIQGVYLGDLPCHQNRPDEDVDTGVPCEDLLPNHNHPFQDNQPINLSWKWYPDLDGLVCKNNGNMESWMLHPDYQEWYLFNTRQQCCAAFGFCT